MKNLVLVEARARTWAAALLLPLLAGCPAPTTTEGCGEFDQVFAWADTDGDGYGAHVPQGWVCALGPGQSANDADCDDTRADVFPGAEEACDLTDNDCDGYVDENTPLVPWYPDTDGDGWGDGFALQMACEQPGADFLRTAGDCDDTRGDVNPSMPEICDGVDDDCDGFTDDKDRGVDPTTYQRWYRDADQDGFGDPEAHVDRCEGPRGTVLDGTDCDDTDDAVNPDATEECNHIDDDCDTLVDDEDPDVDPAGLQQAYADNDGDHYGTSDSYQLVCFVPDWNNDDDCDDNDPLANVTQNWYADVDGDLSGAGAVQTRQCLNPGGDLAPAANGIDCAPNNPAIYPFQTEDCFNGHDDNCNGDVDCADDDCTGVQGCAPPCADEVWSPAALPATRNGNTTLAGNNDSDWCGGSVAPETAFWFTSPVTRMVSFTTAGSAYDTLLYVKTTCGGVSLGCNDDYFAYGLQSRVDVNVTAGVPVLVVVDGFSVGGAFTLHAQ